MTDTPVDPAAAAVDDLPIGAIVPDDQAAPNPYDDPAFDGTQDAAATEPADPAPVTPPSTEPAPPTHTTADTKATKGGKR